MAKVGRKPKKFTDKQKRAIDNMALHQCQNKTIAKVIGCPVQTLEKHFLTVIEQKRAEGKSIKLQQQFENKNPTMLIWFGKQHLGQTDKQQIGGVDGQPIQVQVIDGYKLKQDNVQRQE